MKKIPRREMGSNIQNKEISLREKKKSNNVRFNADISSDESDDDCFHSSPKLPILYHAQRFKTFQNELAQYNNMAFHKSSHVQWNKKTDHRVQRNLEESKKNFRTYSYDESSYDSSVDDESITSNTNDESVYDWLSCDTLTSNGLIIHSHKHMKTLNSSSNNQIPIPSPIEGTYSFGTSTKSPNTMCISPESNNIMTPNPKSYYINNSSQTEEVKATHKIRRKKVDLPFKNPVALSGTWLTNRYIVNNYILLNVLGKGSYAEVRLCKEKNSNNVYAIKIMNKISFRKKTFGKSTSIHDDIKREVAIMKKLRHRNVLRLYEVMDDPNVNKLYLVLEYMKKGDLFQITNGNPKTFLSDILPDHQIWCITRQVLLALTYLHENNIIHGDIKPQNILVHENGTVKIADFGISKRFGVGEVQLGTAGTPAFMCPELCAGKSCDGKKADIYATGATFYCLCQGHPPFVKTDSSTSSDGSNTLIELYERTQNDPLVFNIKIAEGLNLLIQGLMEKNPMLRMSLDEALGAPWLETRPNLDKVAPLTELRKEASKSDSKIEVTCEEVMNSINQVRYNTLKKNKINLGRPQSPGRAFR